MENGRSRRPLPVQCVQRLRSAVPAASAVPAGSAVPSSLVVDPSAPVQFAVDLFDIDESTTAPGSAAALERLGSTSAGGAGGGAGDERPPANDTLWVPLAVLALAFLVLEALVFERDALVRIRRRLRWGRGRTSSGPA